MSAASVLAIYPTGLKVEDVLVARARAGDPSLGHRFTTFPELMDALDREHSDARPVIADALATLVMRAALRDATRGRDVERPGLAAAALRAVGELKAAGLGAAELAAAADAVASDDVRRRLRWLARVADAFGRRLERLRVVDRHDRERRVLALLHAHDAAGTRPRALAGVERLVVAEIYDYSLVQSLIARTLIALVGDAELVALAHPENVDAARFVERTWNRFVEDPAIADKVLPDFVVRGGRAGTLERVLASVFVEPKPPPGDTRDERVAVLVAPSRAAEVEEVGRRVRAALITGTSPSRVAILAHDVGPYRARLEDVALRYGLPLVLGVPRALAEHAGVHAALALLRAVVDGLRAEAVTACLESVHLAAAPCDARRVFAAAGYVDAATRPLADCVAHAEARHARGAESDDGPTRERNARLAKRLRRDGPAVLDTVERLAGLDAPRALAEHARAFAATLHALGFGVPLDAAEPTQADPVRAAVPGEAPSEGAAIAAFERLLVDVAELAQGIDATPITLAEFAALLEEAIAAIDVDAPGPRAGGVRVLAIADARGLDFDDVYVLGLEDGVFPQPLAEDALLGDRVRRELNRAAPALVRTALGTGDAPLGRLLRTSKDRAAEDPFLFYLALSTAERRVCVTYATRDDDGNPVVRSPFVDELVAIVGPDVVASLTTSGVAPVPVACADVRELLHAGVAAAAAGHPSLLAAVGARIGERRLARLRDRIAVERRRARWFTLDADRDADAKEALADAFVGRLGFDPALRTRLLATEWSASRLEELGACGFKFFARRLLRLDADEAAIETLDVREEGSLAHRLLELVLRECDPLPSDPETAVAIARAAADAARPAIAAELRTLDPHLFDAAWRRAVEALLELVRLESAQCEPNVRRLLEWRFRVRVADHRGDARSPVDVTLTGIVDRADLRVDADGRITAATVLDYKNVKREAELSARLAPQALGTTSFQIPLYAFALSAAEDLRWAPGADVSGGYVPLRSHRKRVVRPMPAALLVREPDARRTVASDAPAPIASRIVDLVASAVAGRFDVAPRECSPHCDYRLVCRYEPPPPETE